MTSVASLLEKTALTYRYPQMHPPYSAIGQETVPAQATARGCGRLGRLQQDQSKARKAVARRSHAVAVRHRRDCTRGRQHSDSAVDSGERTDASKDRCTT